jgi:hypothetical protein
MKSIWHVHIAMGLDENYYVIAVTASEAIEKVLKLSRNSLPLPAIGVDLCQWVGREDRLVL